MLTYDAAKALLGRRNRKRLGHATHLEWGFFYHVTDIGKRWPMTSRDQFAYPTFAERSIDVWYHRTAIVTLHPDDSYTLRTGGWYSKTTKQRIEEYAPVWIQGRTNRGGCLSRLPMLSPRDCRNPGGDWLVCSRLCTRDQVEFTDGMDVDRDGRAIDHLEVTA